MSEEKQEFDVEKRTAQYVALRDKIDALKLRHEEELEPFNSALNKLGALILDHLNKTNANSIRTKAGTPYVTDEVSVSIADKSAFWKWLNASDDNMECLEVRANKTAIKDYMSDLIAEAEEDTNIIPVPPPGINYYVRQKLGVRRGNKKSS